MDFSLEYTTGQEEFAKEVREWLDKNIPRDLARPWDAIRLTYDQWQKRRGLGRRLGERGWLYPGYPAEYGGGGLDADHSYVIHRELAKKGLGLPPYYDIGGSLAAPGILACGTEEQKKRYLPPILKGEVVTWQLFTEPEAGTDEANQQTNALRHIREKDYFVVNGSKIFVGGIYSPPDQFYLLTRSDLQAPRHQNLAMFLAPASLPGISIQPLRLFAPANFAQACSWSAAGARGDKHSVFFDDVKIHESCLIGGEREGWKVTTATLTAEHGDRKVESGGGDGGGGLDQDLLIEKLLAQCRSNPNIAKRLRENQQLLESLVNIYTGVQIQRLLSIRNAWLPRGGRRAPYAGPQLAAYSKILGTKLIADIAQILGPSSSIDEGEWALEEGFFEVAERCGICTAAGGTPEALRIVISRALGIGR